MSGRIIGITGVAHSGKTTAANLLEWITGGARDGLAEPLRTFVQQAFDLSHSQTYGEDREKPIEGVFHTCGGCDGKGQVVSWVETILETRSVCSACSGSGRVPTTPRFVMQELGDWGRNVSDGRLWLEWLYRRSDVVLLSGRDVIVDNIRFVNEARSIRGRGSLVIRIRNTAAESKSEHWRMHSTEREVLSPEMGAHVIDVWNDGTHEDLRDGLTRALEVS